MSVLLTREEYGVIAVANDTDYSLTASVFSGNSKRANRAAKVIRAGTVTVNTYGEGIG